MKQENRPSAKGGQRVRSDEHKKLAYGVYLTRDSIIADNIAAPTITEAQKRVVGMIKNTTGIAGLIEEFRPGKLCDSYRCCVNRDGKQHWISSKVSPLQRDINLYLKQNRLREDQAHSDPHFISLRKRLHVELSMAHSLAAYRGMEQFLSNAKEYPWFDSAIRFRTHKMNTSVPMKHFSNLTKFWIPFFRGLGCTHPCEFIKYRKQSHDHIREARKDNGERYATGTWVSLSSTLNEYLRFLELCGEITSSQVFQLQVTPSLEDRKRGRTSQSRPNLTYSFNEIIAAKAAIDSRYANDLARKRQGYACLLGICTGLRRGNLRGTKSKNLHPEHQVPHIVVADNVVNGWSRCEKGELILEACTKTTIGEIALPLVQPSCDFVASVARFLKKNTPPNEYILDCYVTGVSKLWKRLCGECGIKYVHPHGWKHSYATNGGLHLDLYKGNLMLFHTCCLHESMSTTLKYVQQRKDQFLEAFKDKA